LDPIAVTPRAPIERGAAEQALIGAAADFCRRGWCVGTSGSFSTVLQRDPLRLLVTGASCDKSGLTANDLVLVGQGGTPVDGESRAPSAEALLHATIATLTRAGSVLHTHSVWSALLGEHFLGAGGVRVTGYEMQKGLEGVRNHRDEVFLPVVANPQDPSTLADEVRLLLAEWPGAPGFVIAGHGLYTWGTTLRDGVRHVEVLEFLLECIGRKTDLAEPRRTAWRDT
jgi:methylthioribulose-1-phosphate dehydratase